MSYKEIDGKVQLTMTKGDYLYLLTALGIATGAVGPAAQKSLLLALNRINEGNPDYKPYELL